MNQIARIFVVDDDVLLAEVVADLLSDSGFCVEVYATPVTALAATRDASPPDVILLDGLMPGMTGAQFLDALDAEAIRVPVVVFSACPNVLSALKPRAAAVLCKPCPIETLLEVVEGVVDAYRLPEPRVRTMSGALADAMPA
jgi:FixJ family two-component response regulator